MFKRFVNKYILRHFGLHLLSDKDIQRHEQHAIFHYRVQNELTKNPVMYNIPGWSYNEKQT